MTREEGRTHRKGHETHSHSGASSQAQVQTFITTIPPAAENTELQEANMDDIFSKVHQDNRPLCTQSVDLVIESEAEGEEGIDDPLTFSDLLTDTKRISEAPQEKALPFADDITNSFDFKNDISQTFPCSTSTVDWMTRTLRFTNLFRATAHQLRMVGHML
ncbi:hypothetical protein MMC20_005898 [Loxospora ochrophaea]|nr:hypothetical protein [Loxospora ochrophaea]